MRVVLGKGRNSFSNESVSPAGSAKTDANSLGLLDENAGSETPAEGRIV